MMAENGHDDLENDEDFEGLDELSEEAFDFDPDKWDGLEGEDASKLLRGLEAMIPGILRRSIMAGLSNVVMEDGLRSVVTDKNIPKEAVGFVLSQADSTRRELLRIVSREIRLFLENMDFGGEISKILTTLSFEVRTEIRFIPNDEAVKPSIRNRVKVKRVKEDGKEETISEFEDVPQAEGDEAPPKKKARGGGDSRGRRRWSRKRRSEDGGSEGE